MEKGFVSDHGLIYTDNVQHWSQGNNLFLRDKVFVPIHIVHSRFILAVIFIQDNCIKIYDMEESEDTSKYQAILLCYLKKEYLARNGRKLPDGWNLNQTIRPDLPISYAMMVR